MTNEQINIAIAEACGWMRVRETAYGPMGCPPESDLSYTSDDFFRTRMCPVPNFPENLDAMHEAEKVLTSEQIDKYVTILCLEIQPEPKLHHATARQRAEAFLKAIGKWEGGTQ